MQGNILGQSSANIISSFVKIYQQSTEPSKKDGVWIKTNDITKNIYYQDDAERTTKGLNSLPYTFMYGAAAYANEAIYLIGGQDHGNDMYKYNIVDNVFAKLSDIPYNFYEGVVESIDNNIYLIGSRGSKNSMYKYDTEEETYTKLSNIPYSFHSGATAHVMNDIYLFGTMESSYAKTAYKYDIEEGIYTKIANLPNEAFEGTAYSISEDDIIIFGIKSLWDSELYEVYDYNITQNQYVSKNTTFINYSFATKINNCIYIQIKGMAMNPLSKYNPRSNSIYQYSLSVSDCDEGIVAVNNKLYGLTQAHIRILETKINNLGDGLYIILNENHLNNNIDTAIVDIKKIISGEEQSIEAYIGNGIEWKLLN